MRSFIYGFGVCVGWLLLILLDDVLFAGKFTTHYFHHALSVLGVVALYEMWHLLQKQSETADGLDLGFRRDFLVELHDIKRTLWELRLHSNSGRYEYRNINDESTPVRTALLKQENIQMKKMNRSWNSFHGTPSDLWE
jgi:hypothetical protein